MTREEAKRRAELYSALAEGKAIQVQNPVTSKWEYLDINKVGEFMEELNYRIKPEPKYRPFKSQEECWNEMLKHQPFGYIKRKENNEITQITGMNTVHYGELHIDLSFNSNSFYTADNLFDVYTFTDGAPFGIREE